MMFLWIPFLILIAFVVWHPNGQGAVAGCCGTHTDRPSGGAPADPEPIEIARLRLARGEITAAEFEVIRRTLT